MRGAVDKNNQLEAERKRLEDGTTKFTADGTAEWQKKYDGLRDQIEADRYLNSKKAAKAKGLGIRVSKLVPPGTE